MQQDKITAARDPIPDPCTCCQEGNGIAECWVRAYRQGKMDFIAEVRSVLATDYEGHFPDHDCDVCHITKAIALMTPSLQTIMDSTADWMITIVAEPVARESLKAMIAATEDAERRN